MSSWKTEEESKGKSNVKKSNEKKSNVKKR